MSKEDKRLAEENLNQGTRSVVQNGSAAHVAIWGAVALLAASVVLILLGFKILPAALIIVAAAGSAFAFMTATKSATDKSRELDQVTDITLNQGEFLAGFSHRIREPLNNLVIIGDLISDTELTGKQKDLVETLIASTNNMVSTVNELTTQGAGTAVLGYRKPIRFSVTAAIQNTIELFNLSAPEPVIFNLEPSTVKETEVMGDPIVMKQIILDLLNNIPAKPAGSPVKIEVETSRSTANTTIVTVIISSQNKIIAGTDKDVLPTLAERLVDAYGGTGSYSVSGNEYRFAFSVPYISSDRKEPGQSAASRKIAELEREEKKKKKDIKELSLLLVEDNIINQRITFLTLSPLVKNIDTASNGKEALDKVSSADYDIILMDIQMPVMDGLVAAEKIRALEKSTGKHIPIIAITANAMLGDKEKCISAGMDDYISKPFQPSALIEKIRLFL